MRLLFLFLYSLKKYLNIKTFFPQNKLQYFLLNFSVESKCPSRFFKKKLEKKDFSE